MKKNISISDELFNKIANNQTHMMKLNLKQTPEMGLVRLYRGSTQDHIDIFVRSRRKIAGWCVVKFDVLAVYGVE